MQKTCISEFSAREAETCHFGHVQKIPYGGYGKYENYGNYENFLSNVRMLYQIQEKYYYI